MAQVDQLRRLLDAELAAVSGGVRRDSRGRFMAAETAEESNRRLGDALLRQPPIGDASTAAAEERNRRMGDLLLRQPPIGGDSAAAIDARNRQLGDLLLGPGGIGNILF